MVLCFQIQLIVQLYHEAEFVLNTCINQLTVNAFVYSTNLKDINLT